MTRLTIAVAAVAAVLSARSSEQAFAPINHSAWTDIGPGRQLAQLAPAEIARLRRCDTISMYFEHWPQRPFEQVFETGLAMRNSFARVELANSGGKKVISLYRADAPKPGVILYLSNDDAVLTQVIPPATPHVFLRCLPKSKSSTK